MKTLSFSFILIIAIAMMLCPSVLYTQSWQFTNGPNRIHEVLDIAIGNDATGQRLYATDVDELKVSINGGSTWLPTEQTLLLPVVVAAKGNNKNHALVAKDSSTVVHYTTDGGSTWIPVTPQGISTVFQPQRLTISTSDPTLVFLGTEKVSNGSTQTSLWRSATGGADWFSVDYFKDYARTYINDVLPHTNATYADYIFVAGTSTDLIEPLVEAEDPIGSPLSQGIWRSPDKGLTWSAEMGGIQSTDKNITALALSYRDVNDQVLFAAVVKTTGSAKLYQTLNPTAYSINWNVSPALPSAITQVRSMAVSPSDASVILLATDAGIYQSADRAGSWTVQNSGLPTAALNVHRIVFDPSDGNTAYAATGVSVYKGICQAGTWSWTQQITGITYLDASAVAAHNGTLYSVGINWSGIAKYSGGSWDIITTIDNFIGEEVAISSTNPSYVFVGGALGIVNNYEDAVLFQSTNSGTSWPKKYQLTAGHVEVIVPDTKTNSQYVFTGVAGTPSTYNFSRSTNHGSNWLQQTMYQSGVRVNTIAVNKSSGSTYSSVWYAGLGTGQGVWKTSDGGANWSRVALNTYSINAVALNSNTSTLANTIYAASSSQLWKTTNGFTGVSTLSTPFTGARRMLMHPTYPNDANHLWVITNDGNKIYKTVDGGSNWYEVSTSSLPKPMNDLRRDPANSQFIYVATKEGVYKIDPLPEPPTNFRITATTIGCGGGGGEGLNGGGVGMNGNGGATIESGGGGCSYYPRLAWDANAEPEVNTTGGEYEVWRSTNAYSGFILHTALPYTQTSYTDCDVCYGMTPAYYYKVRAKEAGGIYSDFSGVIGTLPQKIGSPENNSGTSEQPSIAKLFQNIPNPFNPQTTINYSLPEDMNVKLTIIDLLGREVKTLVDGIESKGYKSVRFDGTELPSGIYFYRLQAGTYTDIKKMLLTK
ncbi:MAG: T9SS type A sorting domain-containing protein [Ignavibacteriae bacterium]|nr:T9SS type A sorting domain-containing protein [Ignavibacteriota bacterium]